METFFVIVKAVGRLTKMAAIKRHLRFPFDENTSKDGIDHNRLDQDYRLIKSFLALKYNLFA